MRASVQIAVCETGSTAGTLVTDSNGSASGTLSWVIPSMVGRFVLFVPLILVPLAYLTAVPRWPRAANAALGLAVAASLYWTASWSYRQFTLDLAGLGYPSDFMPFRAYMTRDYRSGPDVETPRGLLVPPHATDEVKGHRR